MKQIYIVSHWELVKADQLKYIPQLDIYMGVGPSARMLYRGQAYPNPYIYSVPLDSPLLSWFQLHNIGNYTTTARSA